MFLHPSIHGEIARERHREVLARGNGLRIASMASVERLQEEVRKLVARRQALRERGADRAELESNRLELASRQRELANALIDHHFRHAVRDAA